MTTTTGGSMEGTPLSPEQDPSVNNPDPNVGPTVNPVDNPQVETTATDEDKPGVIQELTDAGANLAPSEVPPLEQLPRLVGALLFKQENGEYPEALHKRFPDAYPDPDKA